MMLIYYLNIDYHVLYIEMLFRTNTGKLIEINKKDYINDKEYYNAICSSYGITINCSTNNTLEYILALSKKGINNHSNQNNHTY